MTGAELAGIARAAASHALERAVMDFSADPSHHSMMSECLVTQQDFQEAVHDVRERHNNDWDEDDKEEKAFVSGGSKDEIKPKESNYSHERPNSDWDKGEKNAVSEGAKDEIKSKDVVLDISDKEEKATVSGSIQDEIKQTPTAVDGTCNRQNNNLHEKEKVTVSEGVKDEINPQGVVRNVSGGHKNDRKKEENATVSEGVKDEINPRGVVRDVFGGHNTYGEEDEKGEQATVLTTFDDKIKPKVAALHNVSGGHKKDGEIDKKSTVSEDVKDEIKPTGVVQDMSGRHNNDWGKGKKDEKESISVGVKDENKTNKDGEEVKHDKATVSKGDNDVFKRPKSDWDASKLRNYPGVRASSEGAKAEKETSSEGGKDENKTELQ